MVITRSFRKVCEKVREAVGADERRWRVKYELCSERTANGREFLYIKGHERCYRGHQLTREEFGLSPVFETDAQYAIEVYTKICQADQPLSPMHLMDVVRDMTLAAPQSCQRPSNLREPSRRLGA